MTWKGLFQLCSLFMYVCILFTNFLGYLFISFSRESFKKNIVKVVMCVIQSNLSLSETPTNEFVDYTNLAEDKKSPQNECKVH